MTSRRTFLAAALALAGMAAVISSAEAKTGSVRIQIFKAGFVVGVSGGKGTLTLGGKSYPLNIGGVSLGATIGASKAELIGRAYNLTSPTDIEGTYTAAEAGVAVAGGNKVAKLKNSRGVVLELKGKQVGLMFSVDLSGMEVALKR
ncbi:MAG: hypothetical protein U1E62_20280 [Alsobacter sp.]